MLRCSDESLYLGHTDDIDERMRQHDAGTATAYTSSRRPVQLIHVAEFETRYEALMMEGKLKGWSRAKELAYASGDWRCVAALAKGKHRWQRSE